MKLARLLPMIALLGLTVLASAQTLEPAKDSVSSPSPWDTDTAWVYLPRCGSGVTHWEIPSDYAEKKANVHILDLLLENGYGNIQFRYSTDTWIWSADCLGA